MTLMIDDVSAELSHYVEVRVVFRATASRMTIAESQTKLNRLQKLFESGIWVAALTDAISNVPDTGVHWRDIHQTLLDAGRGARDNTMVRKISYQSPYEIIALAFATATSSVALATAVLNLRDRFWDSQTHRARANLELRLFEAEEYKVLRKEFEDGRELTQLGVDHQNLAESLRALFDEIETFELSIDEPLPGTMRDE